MAAVEASSKEGVSKGTAAVVADALSSPPKKPGGASSVAAALEAARVATEGLGDGSGGPRGLSSAAAAAPFARTSLGEGSGGPGGSSSVAPFKSRSLGEGSGGPGGLSSAAAAPFASTSLGEGSGGPGGATSPVARTSGVGGLPGGERVGIRSGLGEAVPPPAPASPSSVAFSSSSSGKGPSLARMVFAAEEEARTGAGIGGPTPSGAGAPAGPEIGEPIDMGMFQGDILGRKYCVGRTPEGDFFFDYAKPPAGCDLTKIKFFRVTGASMADVEAELKKLLGKVPTPSDTAAAEAPLETRGYTMANMSGRPPRSEEELEGSRLGAASSSASFYAGPPSSRADFEARYPFLSSVAGVRDAAGYPSTFSYTPLGGLPYPHLAPGYSSMTRTPTISVGGPIAGFGGETLGMGGLRESTRVEKSGPGGAGLGSRTLFRVNEDNEGKEDVDGGAGDGGVTVMSSSAAPLLVRSSVPGVPSVSGFTRRGGNGTRKHKKSRKSTSRKQGK